MREIPSCDTVAAFKDVTASGCNMLIKNSDRDVDESQRLIYFPAAKHAPGEKVKCTYIEVEQAGETYGMIGSQPWWIWGFEHGVNEYGVAIGNEADWSEITPKPVEALLGMDLLRLGLERGKTAYEAMHVIIDHLEKYGQGGGCAYGAGPDDSYHNTYMISDKDEIWLLETVDRHWAAKKVNGIYPISNLYTIQEDFDESSKGLVDFAIANGLHDSRRPFNFAKSFMLINSRNLSGHPRETRMHHIIEQFREDIRPEHMWAIMRDHFEGEALFSRWSPAAAMCGSICMHGSEPGPCNTAATMLIEYRDSKYRELGFTYWGSMCPPCSTFEMPFFNIGYIPAGLAEGTNKYSDDSFWWQVKRMQVDVEADYYKYIPYVKEERQMLTGQFKRAAADALAKAESLMDAGKGDEAKAVLAACSDDCFAKVKAAVSAITAKIEQDLKTNAPEVYRAKFLKAFKERTNMPMA